MSKVIIIGGGAAGMFAALGAVDAGHQVTILEQNEKLGKKIYITGKGRCNLTNACETSEIFENIPRNAKFLYSAIYGYDNFRVKSMECQQKQNVATGYFQYRIIPRMSLQPCSGL